MAETLTIDNTPESEVVLSEEEQDSLEVGEKLVAEQEGKLAGKYDTAKDLEQAYLELQKKLGDQDGISQEGQGNETEEVTEEEPELSPALSLINEASTEFYSNDNTLSEETIEKFSSMSSKDLVSSYLQALKNNPNQQQQSAPVADLTDAEANQIKNSVGGEKEYANIVTWAGQNLSKAEVEAFDSLINTGNIAQIKLAVAGMKAQYQNSNGYEGRMLSGKPAKTPDGVFRSQADLVRAMNDPRYDSDPAYRDDVLAKLDRSDVSF